MLDGSKMTAEDFRPVPDDGIPRGPVRGGVPEGNRTFDAGRVLRLPA